MGKINHRGRHLCKDLDCTVEIKKEDKYCAGHRYLIGRWVKKSEAAVVKALLRQAKEVV